MKQDWENRGKAMTEHILVSIGMSCKPKYLEEFISEELQAAYEAGVKKGELK
jgi:hypothetical protein